MMNMINKRMNSFVTLCLGGVLIALLLTGTIIKVMGQGSTGWCYRTHTTSPPNTTGCARAWFSCTGNCTAFLVPAGTTCEICHSTYNFLKQCYYSTNPVNVMGAPGIAPCTGWWSGCTNCGNWTAISGPPGPISCGVVHKTGIWKSDPC